MLRINNIALLVLPSHVTHFLQIFDVAIASSMKTDFGPTFRKKLRQNIENETFISNIARIRNAAIHAAIASWNTACNINNCASGAKTTGICPLSVEKPLESPYVHELTGELLEKFNRKMQYLEEHFTISNKVITEQEHLESVIMHVRETPRFRYLCDIPYVAIQFDSIEKYYCCNAKVYLRSIKNDCYVLSSPPPFYSENDRPFMF